MIDVTNIRTPLNVARGVLSMYGQQFYFDPYSSVEANKATGLASKIRTIDYKHNVYDNNAESIYLFPPNISIVEEYVKLFWRTKKIKTRLKVGISDNLLILLHTYSELV